MFFFFIEFMTLFTSDLAFTDWSALTNLDVNSKCLSHLHYNITNPSAHAYSNVHTSIINTTSKNLISKNNNFQKTIQAKEVSKNRRRKNQTEWRCTSCTIYSDQRLRSFMHAARVKWYEMWRLQELQPFSRRIVNRQSGLNF